MNSLSERAARKSPGAAALDGHIRICRWCMAVVAAKGEPAQFCAAGQMLAVATYKARARRSP